MSSGMSRKGIVLMSMLALALGPVSWVSSEEQAASKDIVETAMAAGQFSTLVKAIQTAGLVEVLKGPGPFTVFAPTDQAFSELPAEELDALMKDPAKLKQLLLHHVVAGKLMGQEVAKQTSLKTLQGGELEVTLDDKDLLVDDGLVVQADIQASNGVIHTIDTVLLLSEE